MAENGAAVSLGISQRDDVRCDRRLSGQKWSSRTFDHRMIHRNIAHRVAKFRSDYSTTQCDGPDGSV